MQLDRARGKGEEKNRHFLVTAVGRLTSRKWRKSKTLADAFTADVHCGRPGGQDRGPASGSSCATKRT